MASNVNAPNEVKVALVTAKQTSDPKLTAVDKVFEAIHRLAAMPPQLLDLAEKNPRVLRYLTDAAKED